jgi:hypothetical protein
MMTDSDGFPVETPHPLICALNRPKGIRAVCRALSLLETKQALGFFALLFKRLECLDITNTPLGQEIEKVDQFLDSVFSILNSIISDATLPIISALMRVILERHNLVWLAKSRIGLEILTLALSRAELLKSPDENRTDSPPSEADLSMWYLHTYSGLRFLISFSCHSSPNLQIYFLKM